MDDQPIWLPFIVAFIIMNVLLVGMAYMTYYERKVLAAMQDRMGPTRTGPHGLLQPIADGIKLLGKEDLIPEGGGQVGLLLRATGRVSLRRFARRAVIPFGDHDHHLRSTTSISTIADLNVGALFVLAFSARSVSTASSSGPGPPRIATHCSADCARPRRWSPMK